MLNALLLVASRRAEVAISQRRQDADPDIAKLADHYMWRDSCRQMSSAVLADKLGVSTKTLDAKTCKLAHAILCANLISRLRLEQLLARTMAPSSLRYYIECSRYDETPMKVTIEGDEASVSFESSRASLPGIGSQRLATGNDSESVVLGAPEGRQERGAAHCWFVDEKVRSQGMVAKLVQCLQHVALVLRLPTEYVAIVGRTLSSVMAVERTTAESLKEVQLRMSGASVSPQRFLHKARLVCSDRYSAIKKAEQSIRIDRGREWSTLHSCCEIHIVATIHTKSLKPLEPAVSGMIHAALAMGDGANMARFRRALRSIVDERIRFSHGVLSCAARAYNAHILNLFSAEGQTSRLVDCFSVASPMGIGVSEIV